MQILNNSARVLFIISLWGKDKKANWPSSQHSTSRRRITETIRHLTRFNKELLLVDEAEDQVILTIFQARLLPGDFFFSITKGQPKIVAKLLRKAQKYMNVEDAMLAN